MTPSRFARALQAYFAAHSQTDFAAASGVDRGLLSHITNGRRRPTQDAARAIITAMTGADRIEHLRAWLEDQIPENCTGLIRIVADVDFPPAAEPATDEQRAIAWLHHQLDTNVHAIHAIVDLWRASGSPGADTVKPELYAAFVETADSGSMLRVAEEPATYLSEVPSSLSV